MLWVLRHNQKSSCICNQLAANFEPLSLFSAPNKLYQLQEMHFEFPFILTGKFTMGFYSVTALSWLWANQQLLQKLSKAHIANLDAMQSFVFALKRRFCK